MHLVWWESIYLVDKKNNICGVRTLKRAKSRSYFSLKFSFKRLMLVGFIPSVSFLVGRALSWYEYQACWTRIALGHSFLGISYFSSVNESCGFTFRHPLLKINQWSWEEWNKNESLIVAKIWLTKKSLIYKNTTMLIRI